MKRVDPRTMVVGAIVLIVVVGAVGIGWHSRHARSTASGVTTPPTQTSESVPTQSNEDEAAALTPSKFTDPVTLSLNIDANDVIPTISALKGVDNRSTNGAVYEKSDFSGCQVDSSQISVALSISGYNLSPQSITAWMIRQGFLTVMTYPITYPNARYPGLGNANTFLCPVINDTLREHFPSGIGMVDIHHGIKFRFAHRVFDRWTYENRYDTTVPGKGTVKVFAGTFAYRMESNFPGVSFEGMGSVTVKLYKDPDNGQWTIASYEMREPDIRLAT